MYPSLIAPSRRSQHQAKIKVRRGKFRPQPDLEEKGWENREDLARVVHFDRWGSREGSVQP